MKTYAVMLGLRRASAVRIVSPVLHDMLEWLRELQFWLSCSLVRAEHDASRKFAHNMMLHWQ